jgi:hypothetical protein
LCTSDCVSCLDHNDTLFDPGRRLGGLPRGAGQTASGYSVVIDSAGIAVGLPRLYAR